MYLAGLTAGLLMFCFNGLAQASLTTIGTATYGLSEYNLIWDEDNNGQSLIWLDYSHTPSTWENQKYWAEVILGEVLILNLDPGFTVDWNSSSWRLPTAGVDYADWEYYYTHGEYNQATSEMGHLFCTELGLKRCLFNSTEKLNESEFDNLIASTYWSSTESEYNPDIAWYLSTSPISQGYTSKSAWQFYGLAVRSGQVSMVPMPGAVWLLGSGLAGLAVFRKKRAHKRFKKTLMYR